MRPAFLFVWPSIFESTGVKVPSTPLGRFLAPAVDIRDDPWLRQRDGEIRHCANSRRR